MSATSSAVRVDNSALRHEIELAHHGIGDGAAILAALRSSVLYLPRAGEDALMSARQDGVRWVYAFTTAVELAAFAEAREDMAAPVRYATVRGDHLLAMMRSTPGDSAVALDVAGSAPMMVPAPHLPTGWATTDDEAGRQS